MEITGINILFGFQVYVCGRDYPTFSNQTSPQAPLVILQVSRTDNDVARLNDIICVKTCGQQPANGIDILTDYLPVAQRQ